jgi:hypothetical protein
VKWIIFHVLLMAWPAAGRAAENRVLSLPERIVG